MLVATLQDYFAGIKSEDDANREQLGDEQQEAELEEPPTKNSKGRKV